MNFVHLKYALEVAKCRSINKAAENLYMNQPNLSRSIKELEDSLGITIFNRNSKGITVTPQGEEFLIYAKKILNQVEELESMYKSDGKYKRCFSISVPRASYICEAFVEFAKKIDQSDSIEIQYKETNAVRAIRNILQADYKLGIIRYPHVFDSQFRTMLEEKGLKSELICEFRYKVIISKNNRLASKGRIEIGELDNMVEVAHADPYVPSMPVSEIKREEYMDNTDKHIYVFERASQFTILEKVPNTFMWVSPVPKDLLEKYNLVQLDCISASHIYKDVLIYQNGYRFSDLDNDFITELCKAKTEYI